MIYRQRISQKETELLLIFREIMAFDVMVPDVYFERQLQIQRGNQAQAEKLDDVFAVPVKTFWRPVEFGEYVEDPKLVEKWTERNSREI